MHKLKLLIATGPVTVYALACGNCRQGKQESACPFFYDASLSTIATHPAEKESQK
jgi:hypothetical protein